LFSGLIPKILGNEQRNLALSRSTLSKVIPFGIETFLKLLSSFNDFFFFVFFLVLRISYTIS